MGNPSSRDREKVTGIKSFARVGSISDCGGLCKSQPRRAQERGWIQWFCPEPWIALLSDCQVSALDQAVVKACLLWRHWIHNGSQLNS